MFVVEVILHGLTFLCCVCGASYLVLTFLCCVLNICQVLIIGEENRLPYMRPPLSKELWQRDTLPEDDNFEFKSWSGKTRRYKL